MGLNLTCCSRFDRLERRNKLIILTSVGFITVAAILLGQFGGGYLRVLRFVGYALAIPLLFVIAAYARSGRSINEHATQTTVHTLQQYPPPPPGPTGLPPAYSYTNPTGQISSEGHGTLNNTYPIQQGVDPYNPPLPPPPPPAVQSGSTDLSAAAGQPPPIYNTLLYPNQQGNDRDPLPAPPSYDEAVATKGSQQS